MKTNILFTLFSILCCLSSFSQEQFSFKLYFEDAAGNKDTITIGYDENATNGIDAAFGEENIITQPWDSVFEARVGDKIYRSWNQPLTWLQENTYLSKKQILSSYCANNMHSGRVSVQFYTENYPIIVKWDKSIFETEECYNYSLFFGGMDNIHFDALVGTMLAGVDSIIIQPYSSQFVPEQLYVHYFSEFSGELISHYDLASYSNDDKEIGVLQFLFHRNAYTNIEDKELETLLIHPNPFLEIIKFSSETTIADVQLVDLQGKSIDFEWKGNSIYPIDCSPGVYFLSVLHENNKRMTYKILKH